MVQLYPPVSICFASTWSNILDLYFDSQLHSRQPQTPPLCSIFESTALEISDTWSVKTNTCIILCAKVFIIYRFGQYCCRLWYLDSWSFKAFKEEQNFWHIPQLYPLVATCLASTCFRTLCLLTEEWLHTVHVHRPSDLNIFERISSSGNHIY